MTRTSHFNYYKSQTLKNLLQKKDTVEKQIFALKSVKRENKKDGTDFQSFLKNFSYSDGARMYRTQLEYIEIWYQGESINFQEYTVKEEFIEKIREKEPERIVKSSYLKDRVYYKPSEFMELIKERLDYYQDYHSKLCKIIDNFDRTTKELENRVNQVLDYLNNEELQDQYYEFRDLAEKVIDNYYK